MERNSVVAVWFNEKEATVVCNELKIGPQLASSVRKSTKNMAKWQGRSATAPAQSVT